MSRTLLCALALAFVLPCPAWAQVLGARVTAAGGMDAVLYDGSTYTPSYVGQLGLEWRKSQSRGAFRLGVQHYQQNQRWGSEYLGNCGAQCSRSENYGVTGFTFDGTFDLSRGRIRPYVLSGIGIYRSSTTNRANYQCPGPRGPFGALSCTYTPDQTSEYSFATWAPGWHSGLGLSASLGRTTLFTELRVMMLGTDGRQARGMVPLTFGVKF